MVVSPSVLHISLRSKRYIVGILDDILLKYFPLDRSRGSGAISKVRIFAR